MSWSRTQHSAASGNRTLDSESDALPLRHNAPTRINIYNILGGEGGG